MKENSLWFRHDANAGMDARILRLRSKHGLEGVGMYWLLIEALYQNEGYLPQDVIESLFNGVANAKQMLDTCLSVGLVLLEEENIYSQRLLDEIQRRSHIIEKLKEAGRKGGLVKAKNKTVANAKQNPSKHLASRVEESRVDKSREEVLIRQETKDLHEWINTRCGELNLENKVKMKTLDEYVNKYLGKVKLRIKLDSYLIWMFDNNKRVLKSASVGNCFERELSHQKKQILKKQQEFHDTKVNQPPPQDFKIDPKLKAQLTSSSKL